MTSRKRTKEGHGAVMMRGAMLRTLRSCVGFTLTEALATVIIVGLVTAILASGVALGVRQYTQSMVNSEAQMLYSSLQKILDTELRYTTEIDIDEHGNVSGFSSTHYKARAVDEGTGNTFVATENLCTYVQNGNNLAITSPSEPGQLAMTSSFDPATALYSPLLGAGSYNYGLQASIPTITYNSTSGYFIVNLVISRGGNPGTVVVDETFTVKAMNLYDYKNNGTGGGTGANTPSSGGGVTGGNFVVPIDNNYQFEAPVVKWNEMFEKGAKAGSVILSKSGIYYVANNDIEKGQSNLKIDGDGNSSDLITVKTDSSNEPIVVHADEVGNNYQYERGTLCISGGNLYIATKNTGNAPKKDDGNWQWLSSAEPKPIPSSS